MQERNQREIKFRVWHTVDKVMYTDITSGFIKQQGDSVNSSLIMLNHPKQVCVCMQFTGMYDVNGKPIYEDDIVQADFDTGLAGVHSALFNVFFSEGCFKLTVDHPMRDYFNFKVLGNLHENPEYLEE